MSEQRSEQIANAEPALKLIFEGLFFFCFNDGGTPLMPAVNDPAVECRVGFITTSPRHRLTISGKQIIYVEGVKVVTGWDIDLSYADARKLTRIDLDVPGVVSPSVTRNGHSLAINRHAHTSLDKEYFKWIIDLENAEMHKTKLPLVPGVLKPVLHINIGEFYTEQLSEVPYERINVKKPQSDSFGYVAARTGVRIDTLPQGKAFLKIGTSTLPLVTQPGATYEVTFKNDCPACDILSSKDRDLAKELELSDFPLHYHAFNVNVLEQFDFKPGLPIATPPAICYAASGSETTDI